MKELKRELAEANETIRVAKKKAIEEVRVQGGRQVKVSNGRAHGLTTADKIGLGAMAGACAVGAVCPPAFMTVMAVSTAGSVVAGLIEGTIEEEAQKTRECSIGERLYNSYNSL